MLENPLCFICHTESPSGVEKDNYTYRHCPNCGLYFVYPPLSSNFLAEEVYGEKTKYQGNRIVLPKEPKIGKKEKQIFNFLKSLHLKGAKLLDVGSSSGNFLRLAKKAGFLVEGVELNPRTAKTAQSAGFSIFVGTLDQAHFPENSFDIVHAGDVIEHVPDPRAFIKECKRVLKTGGAFIITTPNADSFWARATKFFAIKFHFPWSPLTPPHHLFLFSIANLDSLLEEEGMVKKGQSFCRPPSLRYELGSLHLWGAYKKNKTLGNLTRMALAFFFYSGLYLIDFLSAPYKKKDFSYTAFYIK